MQRWILTFILTPTRFKWLYLHPNEDISLPFQYMLRIWEEVRLGDLNLGVTGTLLSFVGTLLLSHVLWHHEGKGEEEEGDRDHRKIDRVQLRETRKKINGRKVVHFCLIDFHCSKALLASLSLVTLHFLLTPFFLSWCTTI